MYQPTTNLTISDSWCDGHEPKISDAKKKKKLTTHSKLPKVNFLEDFTDLPILKPFLPSTISKLDIAKNVWCTLKICTNYIERQM